MGRKHVGGDRAGLLQEREQQVFDADKSIVHPVGFSCCPLERHRGSDR